MFEESLKRAQEAAASADHQRVLELCAEAEAAAGADEPALSELRFLRADSLRHLGRWADSATEFLRVTEIRTDGVMRARACRAYRLLSETARRLRNFAEAEDYAVMAVSLAEDLGDRVGWLFSLVPMARIHSDRGRMDEAEELIQRVLGALGELEPEDRALIAVAAQTVRSLIRFRRHDVTEAMACLASVREEAATVTHAITRAAYHRQLAILHEVQQEYSTAIRQLNIALELYDQVRFEPGRYDVYWSLSLSYTDIGDLRTARLCLVQCSTIAERLSLRLELGKSKSSFAELAVREGDYEEAVGLYREDLEISRNLGDEQALGHCHRKLAECYRVMGDPTRAAEHAGESIRRFESMSRGSEANQVRILLGRIQIDAGQLAEGAATLQVARQQAVVSARGGERAALMRAEALLALSRDDAATAIGCFEECLQLQDVAQPTRDLAATHFEAGLAYLAAARHEDAKRHLRLAVEVAGMLGSRDLWQQAVDKLFELDVMEAQRLMLKPYLPGRAVDELRSGEIPGRVETATVMFVDMRGATALSGTLSPLELSEVVSAFLGPVVRIILRWDGSVDKFIGDCVMAVFGQKGDEDGAEQATRAGIEIIEYMQATKEIRKRSGASVLEATIGVNTGEVVAGCFGPLLRRDYTVLGYHVNLAQRLQSVAGAVETSAGTRMVISDTTRQGLESAVPLEAVDLTGLKLKGIDTGDLKAWLVLADEAIDAAL